MPLRLRPLLLAACTLWPAMAGAHPHIFVDTGLTFVTDDAGRLTGVEVLWSYDELYSLLILEDMSLDADYDGVLTEAEQAQLQGFDMQWMEGYAGDLYLSVDGTPVKLGPPQPLSTRMDGPHIETRHFRPLAEGPLALNGAALTAKAYDPTFYTAYDLTRPLSAGAGCAVAVTKVDLDAATAQMNAALDGRPAETDDFPEVGEAFADTIRLTCAEAS
ncbi:DUF1007 family protein [Pseudooceanicola nanhaiensis]|uniref:DUF1007 family protein n=1 Tax=Pseudooceanicola nanhaiensis TaxID=375761 RepID=UPI001CD1C507|nr:DUF1007 family protein [Pseudooceanicola nanhaiensis]MCA0922409.1 DUF1007 family protein [Pseudooceanicola nanhaiensis]